MNVLSDDEFNALCRQLLSEYDSIEHMHKHLVDPVALQACTGYDINYPEIVKRVALLWYESHLKDINAT